MNFPAIVDLCVDDEKFHSDTTNGSKTIIYVCGYRCFPAGQNTRFRIHRWVLIKLHMPHMNSGIPSVYHDSYRVRCQFTKLFERTNERTNQTPMLSYILNTTFHSIPIVTWPTAAATATVTATTMKFTSIFIMTQKQNETCKLTKWNVFSLTLHFVGLCMRVTNKSAYDELLDGKTIQNYVRIWNYAK